MPHLSLGRRGFSRFTAAITAVLLTAGVAAGTVGIAPPASADVNTMVHFNGTGGDGVGVMTNPKVYLVFVGAQWGTQSTDQNGDMTFSNDPVGAAPGLQEFFKGLGVDGEQWSGIVTQYCDNPNNGGVTIGATWCQAGSTRHAGYPTGGALGGVWYDSSIPFIPTAFGKVNFAQEAILAAYHFGHSTPASNANAAYMILTPHGTDPYTWLEGNQCAYHSWNLGADLLTIGGVQHSANEPVAVIGMPYVSDSGNCFFPGSLAAFTKEASHEWAETITDPFPVPTLTGQYLIGEAGGWWSGNFSEGNEIADQCNQFSQPVKLFTGTFTVQELWSNDATTNTSGVSQSVNCVASHPVIQGGGLVNGGFETGGTGLFSGSLFGWDTTGTASVSFSSHTGSFSAELGSSGPTQGDSTASQTFTAPALNGTNRLSFWYDNVCPDSVKYDWATVTLHDNTDNMTSIPLQKTCVANSGWIPVSVGLNPGHSYTLTLTSHDDNSAYDPTYTLFDDVALSKQNLDLTEPSWAKVSSYGQVTWDTTNLTPYVISGWVISRDNDYGYATVPASAYSWVDPKSDGHAHSYSVRAYTGTSTAWVSGPSPTTTEPPRNLYQAGQGQVCWDPVLGHNGPGDYYHIYADGKGPVDWVDAVYHDQNTAVCWTLSGSYQSTWAPGSTHSINVTSFNLDQNGGADQSDWSDPLSYVFVPAPTGVQLWNECGRYWQITWNPAPGAATYNIYANGIPIATGRTTDYYGYSYEFSSPLNATYTVTAVDAHGHESVLSAPVSNPIWDATAC